MQQRITFLVVLLALSGNLVAGSASLRRAVALNDKVSQPEPEYLPVLGEAGYKLPDTVEPFPKPYTIDPKRCVSGFWKVECAQDTQMKQRRYYHKETAKEDLVKITPELCYEFCRNITGVSYFGLENGDRCYCTPFYHNTDKGGHGMCDMPCVGDHTKMCGGKEMQEIYQMHDCNNLPAAPCRTPPPPIKNALMHESRYYRKAPVPCTNAVGQALNTVDNSICTIECKEGYFVSHNDLKCLEKGDRLVYSWGQLIGTAFCDPVSCGFPASKPHAKNSMGEVRFPDSVTYQCELGYSLNASASGLKEQDIQCTANASFEVVQDCLPVVCGPCPRGDPKYSNLTLADEQGVYHYGQRCGYECDRGFTLNARPDGDDDFRLTCLATGEFEEPPACLPVVCGPSPDLLHAHTVQEYSSNRQFHYTEVIDYECDQGYSLNGMFDGPTTFSLNCRYNAQYTRAPTCQPVLCGDPPRANNAVYLVRPYVFAESVTYTCDFGYTQTGQAGGSVHKTIFCGHDGQFEDPPPRCQPVECGAAPSIGYSSVNGTVPQMVTYADPPINYVCDDGYSQAVNDDPWDRTENTFTVSCLGTGQFSPHTDCVNIDDCLVRNCGAFGACEDLSSPTGVPLDDYTCQCMPGYEITLHDSDFKVGEQRKLCTNINDCPTGDDVCGGRNDANASRGICVDHVLGYSCTCGAGYAETVIEGMQGNTTCTPRDCSPAVPELGNASCAPDLVGQVVNYDTETWVWTCDDGYTLDGTAGGAKNQNQDCLSTQILSPRQSCVPVSCGMPGSVGHADVDPVVAELFFSEKLSYTCDDGYSLRGDPDGIREFTVECLASGDISYPNPDPFAPPIRPVVSAGPPQPPKGPAPDADLNGDPLGCERVICGQGPLHDNAQFNETRIYVYQDIFRVECNPGYSWDETANPKSAIIKYQCMADGTFGLLTGVGEKKCEKIKCPLPPSIAHTSHEPNSELYFGDTVEYTMDPGYTMDGLPQVNGTFTCTCDVDGEYNGTCADSNANPRPINCGTAPTVEHADVTGSTEFGGQLTATAHTGYTQDGNPGGDAFCTFRCLPSGSFSAQCTFQRVQCGLCPDMQNIAQFTFLPASFLQVVKGGHHSGGLAVRAAPRSFTSTHPKHTSFAQRRAQRKSCDGKYTDKVSYMCADGYRAVTAPQGNAVPVVAQSEPTEFEMQCMEDGDYDVVQMDQTTRCRPVTCDVNPVTDHSIEELPILPNGPTRLQYQETQRFICKDGYSLDGTPTGEIRFTETCQDYGALSQNNACHDIDYCIDNKCGSHGSCVDGALSYSCLCDIGYEVKLLDQSLETCVRIDTCDVNGGYDACSPGGGDCEIGFPEYTCICKDGYENRPLQANAPPLFMFGHMGVPGYTMQVHMPSQVCSTYGGQPASGNPMDLCTMRLGTAGYIGYAPVGSCAQSEKISSGLIKGMTPRQCLAMGATAGPPNSNTCAVDFCHGESVKFTPGALGRCQARVGRVILSGANYQECINFGGAYIPDSKCSMDLCNDTQYAAGLAGSDSCAPRVCPTLPIKGNASSPSEDQRIAFPMVAIYTCAAGYTTDGMADGPTSFSMECMGDGTLSHEFTECQPIKCPSAPAVENATKTGPDQLAFGQQVTYTCIDGHSTNQQAGGPKSFDVTCDALGALSQILTCEPISCGQPPAILSTNPPSVTAGYFSQVLPYSCVSGYSIGGHADNATAFDVTCGVDPTGRATGTEGRAVMYVENKECGSQARNLGKMETPEQCSLELAKHTDVCGPEFMFPAYKSWNCRCCAKNETSGGNSHKFWNVYTTGAPQDMYYGLEVCTAITCGAFPGIANAETPRNEHRFPAQFSATCHSGYTVDGDAAGESTFTVRCGADGTYKDVQECKPVKCGMPPEQTASTGDGVEHVYQEIGTYTCKQGYSTNGAIGGGNNFSKVCGPAGSYLTSQPNDCVDIDYCQNQPCTANGLCTDLGAGVHSPGHSCACYDGYEQRTTPTGPTCAADDCSGNPCTDRGTCTDMSQNAPGLYTCDCETGWEMFQHQANNTQSCRQVKCGVMPEVRYAEKGQGDSFYSFTSFLSEAPIVDALTGQAELYGFDTATYTCAEGYSTDGSVGPESKSFTVSCLPSGSPSRTFSVGGALECQAVRCDNVQLPTISYTTVTNLGAFFKYPENAIFQCDTGYTLDGEIGGPSTFNMSCEATGTFSGHDNCHPITCNAPTRPFATPARDSCTMNSRITYHCNAGHYLGAVVGETSTRGQCQEDGSLNFEVSTQCEPVVCGLPDPQGNISSRPPGVPAPGEAVVYANTKMCGQQAKDLGEFDTPEECAVELQSHSECSSQFMFPTYKSWGCRCCEMGEVDGGNAHDHWTIYTTGSPNDEVRSGPPSTAMVYSDVASYYCLPGYTVGGAPGGSTSYTATCGADGNFVGLPATGAGCLEERTTISGKVFDCENEATELAGATVKFFRDGTLMWTATTGNDGIYHGQAPKGNITMTVERSNYETETRNFMLNGPIAVGQGADMALCPPLPDSAWKVKVTWTTPEGASASENLDAHTYFGCDMSQHVYWGHRLGASDRAGGVTASLDRDSANGAIPETTVIRGGGDCNMVGCCLLQYRVHDPTQIEPGMGSSRATVEVYKGTTLVKTYEAPTCLGTAEWWTVFTIDLSTGENKLYDGDMQRSSYITPRVTGVANWGTSFDTARWSLATPPTGELGIIYGLDIDSRRELHKVEAAKYYKVRGDPGRVCEDIDVTGVLASEGDATCPAGYFLHGLYRLGTNHDEMTGFEQINRIRCCKPIGKPDSWGTCHSRTLTAGSGWTGNECEATAAGEATAMVSIGATLQAGTAPPPPVCSGDTARHGITSSGVFIGGNYIELGFRTNNNIGKMGADNPRPPGFMGRNNGYSGTGMSANARGLSAPTNTKLDYFLPGCPEESFWAGYYSGSSQRLCRNCAQSVVDTTDCKIGGTRTTANMNGELEIIQDITLGLNDRFFKNKITLTNKGSTTLTRVRFMRSHDPDNTVDVGGSYRTHHRLESTIEADGMAVVSSTSLAHDAYYSTTGQRAVVLYYSDDPRAKGAYGLAGLSPGGVYDSNACDSPPARHSTRDQDSYISMCFDVGSLNPGESTEMVYYTALDNRPISEIVSDVDNAAQPVLTVDRAECCTLAPSGLEPGQDTCPATVPSV